ncbi:Ti-type conjugative transfer relaxase TraA [Caulobacter flavus]|uniref:Ti-type conjugative transfer relaxase TraA n=1 Tax=Caulobacter flavus TaxID=1679497 RepID=A0A2N5CZI4_9CAUL|nr:Ti-type conjugative transfer relaxase TraA [Caulobacter flavus]AYV45090.1 Ti-type conjugative transfer relaxase TraA [Caulobacter flavus]PLR19229.1 Ti-type conjugative transfer relaxase TraA [Caulobacter flavus]
MAIYHFSAKVISRANGSSAVAAAAYRSASRLHDERLDRPHDFTNKAGVVHSEILAPNEAAREAWPDQAHLWNAVEASEKRKDAQLAREVEFSIPREMDQQQGVALARDFVQREFVDRGMIADLNVHWDIAEDGSPKPHAHVMLTMREVALRDDESAAFGAKVRDWNSTELLTHWRGAWSEHVNERLAQLGLEARIDHRSFKDQGIALEPQDKIGPAGSRRDERGEAAQRAQDHREIARRNGERIIADPRVALSAITHQQATFTEHDLARFAHRHSDGKDQFDQVRSAIRTSPELMALGRDGQGRQRFTSREMLDVERSLEQSAQALGERRDHGIGAGRREAALAKSTASGLTLSEEQRDAFDHVTDRERLALVVGYAGSGKSAMLGVARDAWEAQGYRVQGAALSGIAAENLEGGSAIPSRTLASLEYGWARGRDQLSANDVLVIDEAGLVGSRQMQRVLDHAEKAGAKVVMVGDAEQLQAIEAGAAFRALTERHGAVEISQIRRQRQDWQRQATRHLATGRTDQALAAYEAAGMVHGHDSKDAARGALIEGWANERKADPTASRMMLAYTRDDVAALNALARERMKADGELGPGHGVKTTRGVRDFAAQDRVMFLRNERSLGVKNGTLGTVETVRQGAVGVRLDDGRHISVDLKTYNDLDHGYAATIHKSQGVTVDRTHVLASGHMDRHAAYVALSRHRDGMALHYSRQDFAERCDLVRTLGRDRPKEMALDYPNAFAARRQIDGQAVGDGRGRFAGFNPKPDQSKASDIAQDERTAHRAVRAYASATMDAQRMRQAGLPVLEHQKLGLERGAQAVAGLWPGAAKHLASAVEKSPGLLAAAAQGRTGAALAAMKAERLAPEKARSLAKGTDHDRERGPGDEPLKSRDRDRGWER